MNDWADYLLILLVATIIIAAAEVSVGLIP